jgi:hypothetical protein
MNHGLNNPYDGSILPLCNSILLLVVQNNQFPLDPCLLAEALELLGGILTPIVRSQNLDLIPCLVLDKSFELLKPAKDFILGL